MDYNCDKCKKNIYRIIVFKNIIKNFILENIENTKNIKIK
jgi:hypothetical protein